MDFDVDNEFLAESAAPTTPSKVTTMTAGETQTDHDSIGDGDSLEFHIEIV